MNWWKFSLSHEPTRCIRYIYIASSCSVLSCPVLSCPLSGFVVKVKVSLGRTTCAYPLPDLPTMQVLPCHSTCASLEELYRIFRLPITLCIRAEEVCERIYTNTRFLTHPPSCTYTPLIEYVMIYRIYILPCLPLILNHW